MNKLAPSHDPSLTDTERQVAQLLLEGEISVDQLASTLELHRRSIYRSLKALNRCGYAVVRSGETGGYVYCISSPA